MRITRFFAITAGIGLVVPALLPIGCYDFAGDCDLALNCPPPSASASSSSGGPDGGTDPSCIPSQAKGPVSEACGIFVTSSQGSDMNTGSKATPVASLAQAIQLAQAGSRRVYACAESFAEAIVVPAGVEIYGGLDCKTGWSYSDAARTMIAGPADQVPLKLSSGVEGTTRLENVSVTAPDATIPGGSSIAVIADNVAAELTRCDLFAGAGQKGADGVTPLTAPTPGASGLKGSNACLPDNMVLGGAGGVTACDTVTSKGGDGGKGGITAVDSGAGQGGIDGMPPEVMAGKGGPGAAGAVGCGGGGEGREGDSGAPGLGGTGNGTISIAGFTGASGQEGGTGTPGQGGGGGGGYKSASVCGNPPTMDGPGASGGGGGGGGCGGKGGGGGMAGGSSIGIISLNASMSLTQVTITTGAGADGGGGAFGQSGAPGGPGGPGGDPPNAGTKAGCSGGKGGNGGGGGPSGGGRGGHSIGIAFQATAPVTETVTVTVGAVGQGGLGAPGNPGGDGAEGMASIDPVEFPAP
jgi:hypothetical protein